MNRHIEKAIDGDPSAIESVVKALKPRIASMAAYYARCCGEDADDLLQEAWLGLLEALPQVDLDIGTPAQYLIQCARWRLLDAIKRAKVRRCSQLEDSVIDDAVRSSVDIVVAAVWTSEFTGKLNSTQQAVLECLLSGLTWREAGDFLGCSSANIAYHVRQIRRQYHEWAGASTHIHLPLEPEPAS